MGKLPYFDSCVQLYYIQLSFKFTVALVCFPIAIAKLAIALLQGYLACINLGRVDVAERAEAARSNAGETSKVK